jgi:positive regulator of sigma E activity
MGHETYRKQWQKQWLGTRQTSKASCGKCGSRVDCEADELAEIVDFDNAPCLMHADCAIATINEGSGEFVFLHGGIQIYGERLV